MVSILIHLFLYPKKNIHELRWYAKRNPAANPKTVERRATPTTDFLDIFNGSAACKAYIEAGKAAVKAAQ